MSFFRRKPKTTTAPASTAPASTAPAAVAVVESGSVVTGDYAVDASHSRLGFSARHAMVTTVRGDFTDFDGTAHVDAETPASSQRRPDHPHRQHQHRLRRTATVTCARATSSTPRRTPRSPSSPPTVERDGTDWTITGDLTIKGITRPVTIPFEENGTAVGPVRQHPRGLRGRHHDQPQGLGPDLERRARDRRRARLREDQARVRRLGDQERLTLGRASGASSGRARDTAPSSTPVEARRPPTGAPWRRGAAPRG